MVAEFINAKGEKVQVFATDQPFKFRVMIDGKPYNPMRERE